MVLKPFSLYSKTLHCFVFIKVHHVLPASHLWALNYSFVSYYDLHSYYRSSGPSQLMCLELGITSLLKKV